MIKKRTIPFRWLPSSWGLSGHHFDDAEAHYLYDGYDLEERLIELNHTGSERERKILNLKHLHGIITTEDRDLGLAELIENDLDRQIAVISANIHHNKIDQAEGEKNIATLKGEPWIRVIKDGLDTTLGANGYFFEFDWNEIWIDELRQSGYYGATEEDIVKAWFQEVCSIEASSAMGDQPINSIYNR